jgi:hypothetical protein
MAQGNQFGPPFLDDPSYKSLGKGFAQRGYHGQRMNDVAHGA